MLTDVLSVATKALSFVCALQAAGIALFLAAFGRELSSSVRRIRRLGEMSAYAALVLVLLQCGLESARMAGELAGIADLSLQKLALTSTTGVAAALRLLGLVSVASGLRGQGGFRRASGVVGATLVAVSFVMTGHTSVHPDRWILAPLLALHLLVVEFWFGALAPLYIVCSSEPPGTAAKTIDGFSRAATRLVPVIFVAGLLMAIRLVPRLSLLGEPYGELLIAKVAGFAALMGLAAANKWRLASAIAQGEARGRRRFRQSVGTEFALIVAVLTITAVMTAFFSPEQ